VACRSCTTISPTATAPFLERVLGETELEQAI
jgi:hypothetical protein